MAGPAVTRIDVVSFDEALPDLASILHDCVAGGASVNFMWPFSVAEAHAWWEMRRPAVTAGSLRVFAARDQHGLAATASLSLDGPCNQRHRADVTKVLTHRRARGRGLAKALMAALEADARAMGLTLLTLDTGKGGEAETLYRRLGWTEAGQIPGYALWPDGRPCDTVLFYKRL